MLILAIDSTATVASVALCKNGSTLAQYTVNAGNTHSVTLLPMIEHMLKMAGAELSDIDLFAASVGPGSFTGVRIGTSTIKGLAHGRDIPCVGVSTLEALAYNLRGCGTVICPAMNARRGQVYTAIFEDTTEGIKRLSEDKAISVTELASRLSDFEGEVRFTGDGYSLVSHMTEYETPELYRLQSAVSVAAVAEKLYNEADDKSSFTPASLNPTYLRKPQAEREREERLMAEGN
ncbi:MAG: tRNA (adenosine(37)-N6)-threonylcarbamoyltransferase complex dimerization subunit type 1 TsaB [Clostridia bacterium]|nr:tRNA (adenosine(37)-N6)-threonylcarbamoyltransferase complex dimerization subunit type 1 TsaB [Clostridia bacterium]